MTDMIHNLYGRHASKQDPKGTFNYTIRQEVKENNLVTSLATPFQDKVVTISTPMFPVSLAHPSLHWENVLFSSDLVAFTKDELGPILEGLRPRQSYVCFRDKEFADLVRFCEAHDLHLTQTNEKEKKGWIYRKDERLGDRWMTYSDWKLLLTTVYQEIEGMPLPVSFDSRWETRWDLPLPDFCESLYDNTINLPELERTLIYLLLDGHPFEMAFSKETRKKYPERKLEQELLTKGQWVQTLSWDFVWPAGTLLMFLLVLEGNLNTFQKIAIAVGLGLVCAGFSALKLGRSQRQLKANIQALKTNRSR